MYSNSNSNAMWRAIIANANRAKGIEEVVPTNAEVFEDGLPTPALPGGGDNQPAVPGEILPTPTLPGESIEQPGTPAVPGGQLPTPTVPTRPGIPVIPLPPIIQALPLPPVCIGCPVFSDSRYCTVRFLHTVPGVGPVVVKFGNNTLASELDYATFTDYVGVIGPYWSVSIYTDTTPQQLLFKQTM